MIEYLDWDSTFFCLKIGKSYLPQLTSASVKKVLTQKQQDKFDLVYLFCEATTPEGEHAILTQGGMLADLKITYQKKVNQTLVHIPDQIKIYSGQLTNNLLSLALASGHDSRFKKDIRLAKQYDNLYTQWIKKSLDGTMADAVLVYQLDEEIQGFVTVKKKNGEGQIGLIAVSEAYRGKGIGSKLLRGADAWYNIQNISVCSVVTQQTNRQACLLYEKNGYTKAKTEIIYHV